jgi:hypothetical protein
MEVGTVVLLQSVLDRLFWLALIAIFLGVVSYLITFVLGDPRSSWGRRLFLRGKVVQIGEDGRTPVARARVSVGGFPAPKSVLTAGEQHNLSP